MSFATFLIIKVAGVLSALLLAAVIIKLVGAVTSDNKCAESGNRKDSHADCHRALPSLR